MCVCVCVCACGDLGRVREPKMSSISSCHSFDATSTVWIRKLGWEGARVCNRGSHHTTTTQPQPPTLAHTATAATTSTPTTTTMTHTHTPNGHALPTHLSDLTSPCTTSQWCRKAVAPQASITSSTSSVRLRWCASSMPARAERGDDATPLMHSLGFSPCAPLNV